MIRLRRWLLGLAVVFAGMLVAFIGVARYRARKAILNLPRQLGLDIKTETNGFTISRSFKGHTQVVLHAAKAVQHQDGKTTLHDVAITIYGAPGSNRVDSIRGGEFDYDQNNGVLRAMGDTTLDVAAPVENGTAPTKLTKRITVHAKGLVVLEKLGIASTKEQIRFDYGSTQGEALGADYERDTGVIRLYHDVHLHSDENGHTEQIDADSAEIQEQQRIAVLHKATLHDAGDSLTAPLVRAALREPGQDHAGTLQQVHASGGVSVHTSTGEQIDAPELDAAVNEQNRLRELQMQGGVRMRGTDVNATANHAVLSFADGRAKHLLLDGDAHVDQQGTSQEARTLQASRIEGDLAQASGQHLALRDLTASGGATLVFSQPGSAGKTQRTQLSGPVLVAHAAPGAHGAQLTDIQAAQGARLHEEDGSGEERTSTSDHLVAHFSPDPPVHSALQSVVQDGNVDIRDTRPATAATASGPAHEASHTQARGQHADFQASTNLLTLTGSPQVSSDGLQLAAERIVVNRDTGDADASGDIRGDATQSQTGKQTAQEPMRFAAAAAHFFRRSGVVVLQGGAKGDARLWTSSGQVEAPVIEADQRANTLRAHAAAGRTAVVGTVRTVLVQAAPPASASAKSTSASASSAAVPARLGEGTTRVFSRDLIYTGNAVGKRGGTADFRGGIRLLQGSDTITADAATAQLAGGTMLSSSGVDTITALGHVRIVQTDRTVTGDKLVYTAATRRAVLTGSPGALPTAHDAAQGTVTGAQLVLLLGQHAGDNTVQVTGAENAPVRTELDVPEKSTANASSRSRSKRKSGPTP